MSETESTHKTESDLDQAQRQFIEFLNSKEFRKQIELGTKLLEMTTRKKDKPNDKITILASELIKLYPHPQRLIDAFNELRIEIENEDKSKLPAIPFHIVEEPLTSQNVALTLTSLTELTTKLWLIAKRHFTDLIEYTQTHDVRFANEAGTTIAWITYNSPLSFGLNVDKVMPGIAEAIITVVDGLSQRKAKREELEIHNEIELLTIKSGKEQLKQQKEMTALEREKQEIRLEKQRLKNEKTRLALVEQRLQSQMTQIEQALELAAKAVDIVYPNADAEIRPVIIQTLVNNILQIDSVNGLQLSMSDRSIQPETKENAEQ